MSQNKVNEEEVPTCASSEKGGEAHAVARPMGIADHLLVCLAEECAEVIQAVSKALRFGLDDDHQAENPDIVSPRLYIARELADLDAVYGLLEEYEILPPLDDRQIRAKREKLSRMMEYAQERGTLATTT